MVTSNTVATINLSVRAAAILFKKNTGKLGLAFAYWTNGEGGISCHTEVPNNKFSGSACKEKRLEAIGKRGEVMREYPPAFLLRCLPQPIWNFNSRPGRPAAQSMTRAVHKARVAQK